MRWDESHESPDVVDRRGQGPAQAGGGIGGLLFLLPWLLRTPFGWVIILGGIVFYVARGFFSGADTQRAHGADAPAATAAAETPEVHFVSFVLDDVQSTWGQQFAAEGRTYRHAKLVLYEDSTQTGCGFGDAATGPFYCPADEKVYLDLGFFRELAGRFRARGQFAQAYVIAHEIGHHVQKLLGISQRAGSVRSTGATGGSVRLELQADCFAGIWARSTEKRAILESGDIESAMGAAAAVGDDRLQRMTKGTVTPESWTHGSSEQRVRWFRRGEETGSLKACDTFSAPEL
ncbi:MAG: neutral zinc metallopeptidase [Myxococcota bacterium]|nr:neutral zinc metallopeptidase [Myxococcota bacterium]